MAHALICTYLLPYFALSEMTPYHMPRCSSRDSTEGILWGTIPTSEERTHSTLLQNCKYQLEAVTNNLKDLKRKQPVAEQNNFLFEKKRKATNRIRTGITTEENFKLFFLGSVLFFFNAFY